eukprot:TRINITY_DN3328_c0_g1_i1.p1 TRINITY_DN3328_c0_g1~~TRINITY_DN3328_c0_g1_i1.p1  ORF type:complete len:1302 (-),score=326.55 TRINITY_DN3328_c0_g1_i1:597-4502(-)
MPQVPDDSDVGNLMLAASTAFGWAQMGMIYQSDDVWSTGVHSTISAVFAAQSTVALSFHSGIIAKGSTQAITDVVAAELQRTHLRPIIVVLNSATLLPLLCNSMVSQGFQKAGYAQLSIDTSYACALTHPTQFIGSLSFTNEVPSSALLKEYLSDVQNASYCPSHDHFEFAFSPYGYDGVYAVARALQDTLEDSVCGGAADNACSVLPGSTAFQLKLREKLLGSSLTGVTGALTLTACPGVDYTRDDLGLADGVQCGDRAQFNRKMINWDGTNWNKVASVSSTRRATSITGLTGVTFLGGTSSVPLAYQEPDPCIPGFVLANGLCNICPSGTFTDQLNALSCIACPGLLYSIQLGSTGCTQCPENAVCYGGNDVQVSAGYWGPNQTGSTSNVSGPYYKCYAPSKRCKGWTNSTVGNFRDANSACATGYRGIVCGECADGYGKSGTTCVQCNVRSGMSEAGLVILTLVGVLLIAALVVYLMHRRNRSRETLVNSAKGIYDTLCTIGKQPAGSVSAADISQAISNYKATRDEFGLGRVDSGSKLSSDYYVVEVLDESCLEFLHQFVDDYAKRPPEGVQGDWMDFDRFMAMLKLSKDPFMVIRIITRVYQVQSETYANHDLQGRQEDVHRQMCVLIVDLLDKDGDGKISCQELEEVVHDSQVDFGGGWSTDFADHSRMGPLRIFEDVCKQLRSHERKAAEMQQSIASLMLDTHGESVVAQADQALRQAALEQLSSTAQGLSDDAIADHSQKQLETRTVIQLQRFINSVVAAGRRLHELDMFVRTERSKRSVTALHLIRLAVHEHQDQDGYVSVDGLLATVLKESERSSLLEVRTTLRAIIEAASPAYERRLWFQHARLQKTLLAVRNSQAARPASKAEPPIVKRLMDQAKELKKREYDNRKAMQAFLLVNKHRHTSEGDEEKEEPEFHPNHLEALKGQFKIVISHFQILSALDSAIVIDWPDSVVEMCDSLRVFLIDFHGIFGVGCWGGGDSEPMRVLFICLTVLGVVVLAGYLVATKIFKQDPEATRTEIVEYGNFGLFLIYPATALAAMQVFECRNIEGEYYKTSDISTICFDSGWVEDATLASLVILVFVVGYPVFLLLALTRNRHLLYVRVADAFTDEVNKFRLRYSWIFDRYAEECYYWEITEMSRKLLLTCVVIFISPGESTQIAYALAVSLFFLVLQATFRPFSNYSENLLQLYCVAMITVTMIYGMLVVQNEDSLALSVIVLGGNVLVVVWFALITINETVPEIWARRQLYWRRIRILLGCVHPEEEAFKRSMFHDAACSAGDVDSEDDEEGLVDL